MKRSRPVSRAFSKYAHPRISSLVFGIALLALAPTQAIGQCAGYQIDVPDVCTCDDPSGYTAVTIKVTAAAGQNWTVKAQNGLYNPLNTAALIAIGAPLTDAGGGMYTLEAKRHNIAGYWIQVTNGDCDLDIRVGNPDPCATPDGCDGIDNDCDTEIDEDAPTWYADSDGDNYGDPNTSIQDCNQPPGYVADNTDCDDTDDEVHPGATEICDGQDNDCDEDIDEDAPAAPTWYADTDGDNYGDANTSIQDCNQPPGYVADNTDCDDTDDEVHPGTTEICSNGLDDDCNPATPDDCCGTNGLLTVAIDPDGTPNNGDEYTLYVHPTDNSLSIPWGGVGIDIPGLTAKVNLTEANADFDGAANTQAIVAALGAGNYAAKLCADLVYNGCDDWYLPALGELNAMYLQLGPAGNNNFADDFYYSSTERDDPFAWGQFFSLIGGQFNDVKSDSHPCRCVRR